MLLAESDAVLEELWRSYAERETTFWPWERELLATIAELLHTLIRQNMTIWGAKKHDIPAQLSIPRPKSDRIEAEKPKGDAITFKEFMRVLGV